MDAAARAELARMLSTPPSSGDAAGAAAGVLLVSIKPCYAQLIEVGFKRVEFRKRVPATVRPGTEVVFYVSAPVQAVQLRARVAAVCRAEPAALWRKVGQFAGTPKRDFDAYFSGFERGVGLVLEQVERIDPAVKVARLRGVGFAPPQSLRVIRAGDPAYGMVARHA